eukprot:2461191-Prymnesium_polylepis.1
MISCSRSLLSRVERGGTSRGRRRAGRRTETDERHMAGKGRRRSGGLCGTSPEAALWSASKRRAPRDLVAVGGSPSDSSSELAGRCFPSATSRLVLTLSHHTHSARRFPACLPDALHGES